MFKKTVLLSTSVAMALSVAAPAFAQDYEDEIIVTATKRQTTLQDTPVAVSVTTGDLMEKAQILDIKDLQSVVPSLRVTQLQSAQNTNFIIRGFGNGANNAGIEPSVGVFIDGVYRSRSASQINDLPKLQRVEVLKGPQSTLFGKNASAGVISVVTAKPSYDFEGYAEAGYGNYNQRHLKAYATGALTDDLAVSVGASLNKRDGYAESVLAGVPDFNDRDRFNLRAQALYEPTDNVSFRLIGDYSNLDENCCVVTNIQNQGASAAVQGLWALQGNATSPLPNDLSPFDYLAYSNKASQTAIQDGGISFHADVDFGNYAMTSISAYRLNKSDYAQDADFTSLQIIGNVGQDLEIATISQELRFTSTGDNRVDWMFGGYFFNENVDQTGHLSYGADTSPYISLLLQGAGAPANFLNTLEGLYGFAPGTFYSPASVITEPFKQENTAYSAFGTLDFHVSDRFTITGGLNYTRDKKQVSSSIVNGDVWSNIDLNAQNTVFGVPLQTVLFGQTFQGQTGLAPTPANIAFIEGVAPGTSAAINAGLAGLIGGLQSTQFQPQFVNFPNSVESGKSDDDKVTYIIRGAFEVNDDLNLYASYGTGFKSTSWNMSRDSRPFVAQAGAIVAAGLAQNNQTYGTRFAGPEEATVIEAGLKWKFDNGSLNLAVFDQTIDGFQSNIFQGTGFVLANAGKQATQGAEVEANYRFSNLNLSGALTYLDAKYDEYTNAPGPNNTVIDLSGQKVAGVPELSLSLGALYNHDFANGMSGYLRGDFQYESAVAIVDNIGRLTRSDGTSFDLEREVKTFNASAGLDLNNGVELQFWARNVFNDEYFLSAFPGVAQAGIVNAYPSQPRTYGATLRYNFN